MRPGILLLLLAALSVAIAACGPSFAPTPTAIPLAATATRTPAARSAGPLSPEPAATTAPTQHPALTATAPSTPPPPVGLVGMDSLMVERQVQDFLDRLSSGDAEAALRLYVAQASRPAAESTLRPVLSAASPLSSASLIEPPVEPADTGGYDVRTLLTWEDGTTREMDLHLEQATGLWWITSITLSQPPSATATPTRPAAARATAAGTPSAAGLAGRLVFQVSSGGGIYTINADGSGLQRLADGLDPAWSPDGKRIAFSRWRDPRGVYVLSSDGAGAEERVVDGSPFKEVAWSPDGRQLAYVIGYSFPGGEFCWQGQCFELPPIYAGQIWTANLDTGEYLTLPVPDYAVHAPAWDPSGTRIVYAGNRGLAWIDPATPDKSTGRFPGGSPWDTSPAFSPDGRQIAYMGRIQNRWEIFRMNADGSGRTRLTQSDPDLNPAPDNVAPAWSPDGKHIVFLSNRDGRWRMYVMNADGSGQRPMFGAALDKLGIRYEYATERVVSWTK
jgi:hypothetical protein